MKTNNNLTKTCYTTRAPFAGNTRKTSTTVPGIKNATSGITLIALVITIIFSYDEKIKCSNSKGFLLVAI